MRIFKALAGTAALLVLPVSAHAADAAALAEAFGARPASHGESISPSGKMIVYLIPVDSNRSAIAVANVSGGTPTVINLASDKIVPQNCSWKSEVRLVCQLRGISKYRNQSIGFTRYIAVNPDGTKLLVIGQQKPGREAAIDQYRSQLLDLLPDDPDHVLMAIDVAATSDTGTNIRSTQKGMSVQLIDINTGSAQIIESGMAGVAQLDTDQHGHVRFMSTEKRNPDGSDANSVHYFYREPESRTWQPIGSADLSQPRYLTFEGFNATGTALMALKPYEGRSALFEIATDGRATETLTFAHPERDVTGVWRFGKYNQPVAAATWEGHYDVHYFDPANSKLTRNLAKALPNSPNVYLVDESWDGSKKLVVAASDNDPGHTYRYDSATHELNELTTWRPELANLKLSPVESVSYTARDGTKITASIIYPPGRHTGPLPAVVIPEDRSGMTDRFDFNWLAHYFSQLGYVVLLPNYRKAFGAEAAAYRFSGFKSWPSKINDINDATHWLISQRIADPGRVAILGWTYGGYNALQASIVEPNLYKATIAIDPITDLRALAEGFKDFSNYARMLDIVGNGPHIAAGSPARNAASFKAPVLLFHGASDEQIPVAQSQLLDAAMQKAGKAHKLIVYPGLDGDLDDSTARDDMLDRSATFLAANMGAP